MKIVISTIPVMAMTFSASQIQWYIFFTAYQPLILLAQAFVNGLLRFGDAHHFIRLLAGGLESFDVDVLIRNDGHASVDHLLLNLIRILLDGLGNRVTGLVGFFHQNLLILFRQAC